MILIDANLLVYAHVSSLPQHREVVSWLDTQLMANAIVGMPWQSLLGFARLARLVTNPRTFERPLPIQSAWKQVENWLDCPTVRVPVPGDRYREILGKLMREFSVRRLRVRGSEFEFRVWSSEPIVLVLVVRARPRKMGSPFRIRRSPFRGSGRSQNIGNTSGSIHR